MQTFPLPPLPDCIVHLIFRDPIPDQPKADPQRLDVRIPCLIVEEEHVLVLHPTGLVHPGHMRPLVAGKDFPISKVVGCSPRDIVRD